MLTVRFINKGMQLVSGSSDGLVRLWTIRTGECENTFDVHTDRVWAIATATVSSQVAGTVSGSRGMDGEGTEEVFFSGGSDSKLLCWRDATAAEERGRLNEAEQTLLVEQQMQNDLRNKRFDKVGRRGMRGRWRLHASGANLTSYSAASRTTLRHSTPHHTTPHHTTPQHSIA